MLFGCTSKLDELSIQIYFCGCGERELPFMSLFYMVSASTTKTKSAINKLNIAVQLQPDSTLNCFQEKLHQRCIILFIQICTCLQLEVWTFCVRCFQTNPSQPCQLCAGRIPGDDNCITAVLWSSSQQQRVWVPVHQPPVSFVY